MTSSVKRYLTPPRGRTLVPAVLGLAAIAALMLLVWRVSVKDTEVRLKETDTVCENLANAMSLHLVGDIDYFEMMSAHFSTHGFDHAEFDRFTISYTEQHPGLINISWLDPTYTILYTEPYEQNKQIVGMQFVGEEPVRASRLAVSTRTRQFTGPFDLIQGTPGIILFTPTFDADGNLIGLVAGVYSLDDMVSEGVPDSVKERFHIDILDKNNRHVTVTEVLGDFDPSKMSEHPLTPPGNGLKLRLYPHSGHAFGTLGLVMLGAIALLVGGLAWGWHSRHNFFLRLDKTRSDLQKARDNYRGIFEGSPVAIALDDFSALARLRDRLRSEGVEDVRSYLLDHPEALEEAARSIVRLDVNRNALRLFGQPDKSTLTGAKGIRLHFTDRTRADFLDYAIKLMEGETNVFTDTELIKSDGRVIHVHITSTVMPGSESDLSNVLTCINDMTDTVLAQEELQAAKDSYQGIFEGSPVAITVNDFSPVARLRDTLLSKGVQDLRAYLKGHPDELEEALRRIIRKDANRNAVELYGAPDKKHLLDPEGIGRYFTKKTATDLFDAVLRFMEGETETGCETELVTHDGRLKYVYVTGTVVPGSESDLSNVLTGITDITDNVLAQRELQKAKDRYQGIFEGSPVAITVNDLSSVARLRDRLKAEAVDNVREYLAAHPEEFREAINSVRRLDANPNAVRLYGAPDKEALLSPGGIGRNFTDKTHSDFLEYAIKLMEGNNNAFVETELLRNNGELLHVHITSTVMPEAREDLSYVLTCIVDVTASMLAKRELQRAKDRYQGIFEGSPVAITVNDLSSVARLRDRLRAEGVDNVREYLKAHPGEFGEAIKSVRRLDANPNAVRLYGAPDKEALLGQGGIGRNFTAKTASDLFEHVLDFIEGKAISSCDTELVGNDGRIIYVNITSTVVPEAKEDLSYVLTCLVDVTASKVADRKVRDSEKRLKAIMDNIPDRAWLKAADGSLMEANEPYMEACGRTREELIGKTDRDIWPEAVADYFIESDRRVEESAKRTVFEERIAGGGGTDRWFETIKTPIFDDEGRFSGTAGIAHEITGQKLLEMQRSELHAMISHDIRTPLTLIAGNVEILEKKYPDDPAIASISSALKRSVGKISEMFEDFVALSRLESAGMNVTRLPADLAGIITEICEEFREEAGKKKIDLELLPAGDIPRVYIDTSYMQRAISNLIQNAVKYTPREGRVTVTCAHEPGDDDGIVVVEVADNGPGIPPSERDKVFRKYYRYAPTSSGTKGSGLGLAIVKAVAEAHGGFITLDSGPDGGSVFRLGLPAKRPNWPEGAGTV